MITTQSMTAFAFCILTSIGAVACGATVDGPTDPEPTTSTQEREINGGGSGGVGEVPSCGKDYEACKANCPTFDSVCNGKCADTYNECLKDTWKGGGGVYAF